jgi:hypothetical protein
MRIIISCHVESGYATDRIVFDKNNEKGALEGTRNAIRIADDSNAIVSFMLMPETLGMTSVIDFGAHEIGLHIHPDDRSLIRRGFGPVRSLSLRDYDFSSQKAMILTGKEIIEDVMGARPRTFAAGMWSVGNETVKALAELGFSHDCSPYPGLVRDYCDWGKLPRIRMPYKPSEHDYQLDGDVNIVIVPVSGEITGGIVSPENRVGLGFLKAAFQEYYEMSMPVFHIAFHSPSMTSRYYRQVFSELVNYISKYDVRFCPASEVRPQRKKISVHTNALLPYLKNLDPDALSYLLRSLPHRSLRLLRRIWTQKRTAPSLFTM